MPSIGEHSRREILTQGAAWASAMAGVQAKDALIRSLFDKNRGRDVLFAACGSPYFLGLSAAAHTEASLAVRAQSVPSSEIIFYPETMLPPGPPPLTIALSRSGETSETIAAVRALLARGGDVLAIGCDGDSTILKMATVSVEVSDGREQSVAQTRSFSGMLLAAHATIALAAGDRAQLAALSRLPALADAYVNRVFAATENIIGAHRIDSFFFLGSGSRYGLACEAMLKMKEMSLSHAEAFHFMEFRHGPMSMVDEHTLVVGLVSEQAAQAELAVLKDMSALGGQTLAIGESAAALAPGADSVIAFESGLPPSAHDLLYMPPLQSLAFHRAMSKELDCDNPRNLVAFVTLPDIE